MKITLLYVFQFNYYLTIRLNQNNLSIHIKNTNLLRFLEKYTSIYI
nr:MAG TPA: hypothetical protein [Caudoviricetes sp.]